MDRPSVVARALLLSDFHIACRHFGLSDEARDIAWRAAEQNFRHASAYYRAIANSLRTIDPGAKARTVRVGRRFV